MRGKLLWAALLLAAESALFGADGPSEADVYLGGPSLKVADLQFTIPSRWISQPLETSSRAGQWRIPPSHGATTEDGEAVVFSFGPGVGGNAKDNIEAWIGTMENAEGHPAAAEVKHREIGKLKISQVVVFGTYREEIPLPGVPPQLRMNHGLIGIVIETPQDTVFWRFTGPEALVTANLPLVSKIVDTAKIQTP